MKKLFENKLVVGGVCIVIAAILAFLVLPGMYKQKEKTIYICRLQSDITAGTKIEAEMLKTVEVGSYGLPESVVKNPDDLVGKYAKVSLTADDYLYSSKFADYVSDERFDKAVAEGKRLIAVSVPSNAASVANQLKAGDRVTVAYYTDDNVIIDDALKGIEIYSVENEDAQNLENVKGSEDKEDTIAANVTLIATEEQAAKLISAEYSGKLHIMLENRGVA
ncbi:MAG: Flp pilus assembly protein CpaB [Clostridia bacterium]|nr:Flp pilus assembly protein CpaB [Clostridia bacterium]MCI8980237.1 Flp pilus assembly protein CpaB [Clostridia bacterium]MCI9086784.1 Flp pilus assembly protein CpaB [Clostridia bacterium]NDO20246.1 Flp pilus assembly protein CpaB [Lachnospiraceae bacterium MD329]